MRFCRSDTNRARGCVKRWCSGGEGGQAARARTSSRIQVLMLRFREARVSQGPAQAREAGHSLLAAEEVSTGAGQPCDAEILCRNGGAVHGDGHFFGIEEGDEGCEAYGAARI